MQNSTRPVEDNLAIPIEIKNAHIFLDPVIPILWLCKTMHIQDYLLQHFDS